MKEFEKKIDVEQQQDAAMLNDDDMENVSGGAPGVNTIWGVRDGQIATSPQKKPATSATPNNHRN